MQKSYFSRLSRRVNFSYFPKVVLNNMRNLCECVCVCVCVWRGGGGESGAGFWGLPLNFIVKAIKNSTCHLHVKSEQKTR